MIDEIEYRLSAITADQAATMVIEALTEVEKLGSDSLRYCMQPSNLLAIAGLKSVSPHNTIDEDFSDEQISSLNKVLISYDCAFVAQNEYGSSPDSRDYSVMNFGALQTIAKVYPVMDGLLAAPTTPNWADYVQWSNKARYHLAMKMDENILPKKWLQDWWNPHHLHFGMMLGYPGIALASTAKRGIKELDRQTDMELVEIEIASSFYDSIDISYAVDKQMINHEQIKKHSQLWKDTLQGVYNEFNDEKLSALDGFNQGQSKVIKL